MTFRKKIVNGIVVVLIAGGVGAVIAGGIIGITPIVIGGVLAIVAGSMGCFMLCVNRRSVQVSSPLSRYRTQTAVTKS